VARAGLTLERMECEKVPQEHVPKEIFRDKQPSTVHELHELCEIEEDETNVLVRGLLIAQRLLDGDNQVVLILSEQLVPTRDKCCIKQLSGNSRQELSQQTARP
jgi:hypothetical protein